MNYFLGLDGGGSQTVAVVVDDDLQILGRGLAGPSNHYVAGAEAAAVQCLAAAEAALLDAARIAPGLAYTHITAWGFGLAGVRRADDAALVHQQLRRIVDGKPFVLDHDAAAAHRGALEGRPGILLSAGTGAISFGIDELGERDFADGWGPLLGDEGGGYWMGQEALKAVCRAADGRGPRTRLTSPILGELGCRDPDELVRLVYSTRIAREDIARLAGVVLRNASAGSAMAMAIRERAVVYLGNSVVAVATAQLTRVRERAGYRAAPLQEVAIALRGGLFDDDFLRASVGYNVGERLVELKRDYWPIDSWRVVKPRYEAAIGAALLGRSVL